MREKQGRLHNETCAWRREDASPNCVCCSYFYWSSAKPHRWSVSIASYQSNDIGSILTKVRLLNKKVNVAIRLNSCILKCILLHWCHKDEENEIEGLSVKITSLLVENFFFSEKRENVGYEQSWVAFPMRVFPLASISDSQHHDGVVVSVMLPHWRVDCWRSKSPSPWGSVLCQVILLQFAKMAGNGLFQWVARYSHWRSCQECIIINNKLIIK